MVNAQMQNHSRMVPLLLENQGQLSNSDGNPADNVLYYMQTPSLDFFITDNGLSYVFKDYIYPEDYKYEPNQDKNESSLLNINWHRVDVNFEGAHISRDNAKISRSENSPGVSIYNQNIQTGPEGINVVDKVIFENAWLNIDIEFIIEKEYLKYNFILHPGADISQIKMIFNGQDDIKIEDGHLKIVTSLGSVEEGDLVSFTASGKSIEIESVLNGNNIHFESDSDISEFIEDITIDPPLVWSTYYGGSGSDEALVMEYNNGNGFIYALLKTQSTIGFDTLDQGGISYYQGTNAGNQDIAIVKYDENGIMNWVTYIGGSGNDDPSNLFYNGVVLIFVGYTQSVDFPTQFLPGAYNQAALGGTQDGFIMAFTLGDALIWSTYFGGSANDKLTDVAFSNNKIMAVGETFSTNIPLVDPGSGAYYDNNTTGLPKAYLAEFDMNFAQSWGSYLGGSGFDVISYCAMDNTGRLAVAFYTLSNDLVLVNSIAGSYSQGYGSNQDVGLMVFDSTRANILTTYVGGNSYDGFNDIVFDDKNQLLAVGVSSSSDFPVINTIGAGFYQSSKSTGNDGIQMLFSDSLALLYSSFFGGNNHDAVFGITIDSKNRIYVVGDAQSSNLPVVNPMDGSYFDGTPNGSYDGFLAEYDSTFNVRWVTYLGGSNVDRISDVRVTPNDHIFTVGFSQSNNHPTVDMGAYYNNTIGGTRDAILTKFIPCPEDFDTLYGTDSVCFNEAGMIYASGGGTSFLWSTTETNDTIYPVITTDTMLTVVVVGPYGCIETDTFMVAVNPLPVYNFYGDTAVCFNDSATISVDGGYSYLWEYGQTDSSMTYLPAASEYVDVAVTSDQGCVYSDSTYLTVYPLPVPSISGDTAVCLNDTATMIASGASSYFWSDSSIDTLLQVSPTPAGIYNYYTIATDTNMCSDTAFFSVEIYPLPIFWLGNDTTLCQGDSLLLNASNPGADYLWNTTDTTQTIYVNSQNQYYVLVTDSNACNYSDSIDVSVIPYADATITDIAYVCENISPFDFSAAENGGVWSGTGITNTTNGTFDPTVAGVGFYNIYYVISGFCGDADTSQIEVAEIPVFDIYTTDETCAGANDGTVVIEASNGQTPYTYLLDTILVADTNILISPGVYLVTVIDNRGCADIDSAMVLAEDFPCGEVGYFIPNIFSPNGDGDNDVLYVHSNFIDNMQLLIYDRFGEKVFESRSIDIGWDGKYNGTPVTSGVYFYIFKADLMDGSIIDTGGNITVVR